ncbi:MAG: hypothetical protein Q4A74_01505 [Cardiobacteriaceae bacterium]|nr:hypothetical protein [Cardiobacteriaceae bacterium]
MFNIVCYVGLFGLLSGCTSVPYVQPPLRPDVSAQQSFILNAETQATPAARQVLVTLRQMVQSGEIVRGGCWDYLQAGFTRAGFPETRRQQVFKGDLKQGPYADPTMIMPGDWLYYVNHSYNDIEHSGVFVAWTDFYHRQALVLSYAGEQRGEPGRYKVYDLSHVYQIIRVK